MFEPLLEALEDLVERIPWYRVSSFFSWCLTFARTVGFNCWYYGSLFVEFVKAKPGTIVTWFLSSVSAYDAVKRILAHFGIHIRLPF